MRCFSSPPKGSGQGSYCSVCSNNMKGDKYMAQSIHGNHIVVLWTGMQEVGLLRV